MRMCPLCASSNPSPLHRERDRVFFLCPVCDLAFNDPATLPAPDEEKSRYLTHENTLEDEGYRKFLSAMHDAIVPYLDKADRGLDYGSGTAPMLAKMLGESGFACRCYDPFFHVDESALSETYDFIVTTETAEHFHHPGKEFATLKRLLRPGGHVGVMTQMLESWEDFPNWYYHRDPTHVAFYRRQTFEWLAARFGWQADFPRRHVVIFRG